MSESHRHKINSEKVLTGYDDPQDAFWAPYVKEAEKYDKTLVDSWRDDMDVMLVFAGLFSATVTAFILESYKHLQPDPGNTTVDLLQQISLQLAAMSNGSQVQVPLISDSDGSFQPLPSALRVNVLWLLSLVFNLVCALAATLIKQWARNYTQAIQHRSAPHIRARVRTYLWLGVETWKMESIVQGLPMLLHISLFFFLLGLVDFLLSINRIVAGVITGFVVVWFILYGVVTSIPIRDLACPYKTPLSDLGWRMWSQWWSWHWNERVTSFSEEQEECAKRDSGDRDSEALCWALEVLNEDDEILPLVAAIPDFLQGHGISHRKALDLLLHPRVRVDVHISRLLAKCVKDRGLSSNWKTLRARCAILAFEAFTVAIHNQPWSGSSGDEDTAALLFLVQDSDSTIANLAANAWAVIISKLRTDMELRAKLHLDTQIGQILAPEHVIQKNKPYEHLDPLPRREFIVTSIQVLKQLVAVTEIGTWTSHIGVTHGKALLTLVKDGDPSIATHAACALPEVVLKLIDVIRFRVSHFDLMVGLGLEMPADQEMDMDLGNLLDEVGQYKAHLLELKRRLDWLDWLEHWEQMEQVPWVEQVEEHVQEHFKHFLKQRMIPIQLRLLKVSPLVNSLEVLITALNLIPVQSGRIDMDIVDTTLATLRLHERYPLTSPMDVISQDLLLHTLGKLVKFQRPTNEVDDLKTGQQISLKSMAHIFHILQSPLLDTSCSFDVIKATRDDITAYMNSSLENLEAGSVRVAMDTLDRIIALKNLPGSSESL